MQYGRETLKKSVSWAKESDLVEIHEIEIKKKKGLSYRLSKFCCSSKKNQKRYY